MTDTGEFWKTDPVSSDASCEMRVPFLLDIVDAFQMQSNKKSLKEEFLEIPSPDKFDDKAYERYRDVVNSIAPPLEPQMLPNKAQEIRTWDRFLSLIDALSQNRTQYLDKLGFLVDDKPRGLFGFNIEANIKTAMCMYTVEYMRHIANVFLDYCIKLNKTKVALAQQLKFVVDNADTQTARSGRKMMVVPVFEAERLIMAYEWIRNRPLLLTLARIGYAEDLSINLGVLQFYYVPDTKNPGKFKCYPALVTNSKNLPSEVDPKKPLKNIHAFNLIPLPNARENNSEYNENMDHEEVQKLYTNKVDENLLSLTQNRYTNENIREFNNTRDLNGILPEMKESFFYNPDNNKFIAEFSKCDITSLIRLWGAAHPPVQVHAGYLSQWEVAERSKDLSLQLRDYRLDTDHSKTWPSPEQIQLNYGVPEKKQKKQKVVNDEEKTDIKNVDDMSATQRQMWQNEIKKVSFFSKDGTAPLSEPALIIFNKHENEIQEKMTQLIFNDTALFSLDELDIATPLSNHDLFEQNISDREEKEENVINTSNKINTISNIVKQNSKSSEDYLWSFAKYYKYLEIFKQTITPLSKYKEEYAKLYNVDLQKQNEAIDKLKNSKIDKLKNNKNVNVKWAPIEKSLQTQELEIKIIMTYRNAQLIAQAANAIWDDDLADIQEASKDIVADLFRREAIRSHMELLQLGITPGDNLENAAPINDLDISNYYYDDTDYHTSGSPPNSGDKFRDLDPIFNTLLKAKIDLKNEKHIKNKEDGESKEEEFKSYLDLLMKGPDLFAPTTDERALNNEYMAYKHLALRTNVLDQRYADKTDIDELARSIATTTLFNIASRKHTLSRNREIFDKAGWTIQQYKLHKKNDDNEWKKKKSIIEEIYQKYDQLIISEVNKDVKNLQIIMKQQKERITDNLTYVDDYVEKAYKIPVLSPVVKKNRIVQYRRMTVPVAFHPVHCFVSSVSEEHARAKAATELYASDNPAMPIFMEVPLFGATENGIVLNVTPLEGASNQKLSSFFCTNDGKFYKDFKRAAKASKNSVLLNR